LAVSVVERGASVADNIRADNIREAKRRKVKPETEVIVRFSGELYKWIVELKDKLREAESEEDVPTIALELLYNARDKEIRVGSGDDFEVFRLWR
jgi:hypothetical protein